MDPLSQGSLGAALAQSGAQPEQLSRAVWLGCLAGLAPDLDVLIFSTTDPLLFLEYHRQFTHSLSFIPVGALIVAAILHRWLGKGLRFSQTYMFCLLGYATHGLLDACTTYGTQLLWPFSDMRVAWNTISIIDPIFTLPVVMLVVISARRKRPWLARIAILWAAAYMLVGVIQRERAETLGTSIAQARGEQPLRLEAKPGFANVLVWKLVYETEHHYQVDAVRIGVDAVLFEGDRVEKLDLTRHFPWLDPDSQQARDVERFRWFSNGYLALDPNVPNRIIDVRYSVVPNQVEGLWAIDLVENREPHEHVEWRSLRRTTDEQTRAWWAMLVNETEGRQVD